MSAENPAEGQSCSSSSVRPANYVGRVGALAVALGVGSAILGFSGTALADTGAADAVGSAGQESTGGSGQTASRAPRTNVRQSASADSSSSVPAPAAAVDAPTSRTPVETVSGDTAVVRTARESRRSVRSAQTPNAGTTVPQPPVISPEAAPVVEVPAATPVAPVGDVVPEIVPIVEPVAQVAPVMTAAESGALAAGEQDPLAALGGGTGTPGTEPMVWAAAAVARREDLAGPTPEVPAAASVGTAESSDTPVVGARLMTITSINGVTSGYSADINTTITIVGTGFYSEYGTYPVTSVIFGCTDQSSSGCQNGVAVKPTNVQTKEITVTVPSNAQSGYIQISTNQSPPSIAYSGYFTVTVPEGVPTISGFTPQQNLQIGAPVTITGTNFTGTTAVNFNGVASNYTVGNVDPVTKAQTITAWVPFGALTQKGQIQVVTPGGTVTSAGTYSTAACGGVSTWCGTVSNNQSIISGQISKQLQAQFSSTILPPSTATIIGNGAADILIGLMNGITTNQGIAFQISALATNADVLTFVSKAVAANLEKKFAKLPVPVANTIGNAAASFVTNSFGNNTVALAFVPVLQAINLPTTGWPTGPGAAFIAALTTGPGLYSAILSSGTAGKPGYRALDANQMQAALMNGFFGAGGVQAQLGVAVTGAVNVLFGLGPNPPGAQPVPDTAVAGYLGQVGASKLLKTDVPDTNPLAVTLGNAVETLFQSIGGIVATSTGNAFTTFLQQPALSGQASVASTLATTVVNDLVNYLEKQAGQDPPPAPLPLKALAPGAGVAVNSFVTSLLTGSNLAPVTQALGTFVSTVIPGVLGDTQFQGVIADEISAKLVKFLGPTLSDQFGSAVAGLLGNTVVSGALVNLINTTLGSLLNSQGVGAAFGGAAGAFTTAYLSGESLKDAQAQGLAALKANADFDAAIGPAVTAGVQQALQDKNLWNTVDATLSGLFTGLFNAILNDPTVQTEVVDTIAGLVETKIPGPLGELVGQQAGEAVLSLLSNTTVQSAVVGLVDTIVGDFWRAPGVVTAFSQAAGELATGWAEDIPDVQKQVLAELKGNPQVVSALNNSVVAAVTQFVGNTGMWQAVDSTVLSLLGNLIGDAQVQTALSDYVQTAVEARIPGPLGTLVGAQVGAAVVGLVTNPVLDSALSQLVDTVTQDFFGASGVAEAFGVAAGQVALGALAGDYKAALVEAQKQLQANTNVQTAIQTAVGDAVGQFLGNAAVWQAVDGAVVKLLGNLVGSPQIQTALSDYVQSAIEAKIPGPLGTLVGAQVGAAVVSLVTNPVIDAAVSELVDSVTTDFFTSYGVVAELAGVASQLALVLVTGGDFQQAKVEAQQELRDSPAIDAGIGTAVGDAVTLFLSDKAVWQTVDSTVASLLTTLIGDPQVQTALSDYVSMRVQTALPGQLGALVGPQVGAAVVSLITNPIVGGALLDLVDSVAYDFFTTPGVVNVFADSASELAESVFTGANFQDALALTEFQLRNNPVVDAATQASVGAAVTQFLGDTAVWQVVDSTVTLLLTGLVTDPAVQVALGDYVSGLVQNQIPGQVGELIGGQVGAAVVSLITNPVVGGALLELVDTVAYDFFTTPGVDTTIGNSVGELALLLLTGGNFQESLATLEAALRVNPIIDGAANESVGAAVTQFIGDAAVWTQVGQTLDSLVTNLLGEQLVQQYAGDQAAAFVTKFLGSSPIASPVGYAVGTAVQQLLGTAGVPTAFGNIVGALLPTLFGQPGVPAEVGDVSGQLAVNLLFGMSQQDALAAALASLEASTVVQEAVRATIATELNLVNTELLSVENIQQALGSIVTSTVIDLAGDPAIQTFVARQYGQPVANLLSNTAAVDELAAVLGQTVTGMLGYTGFSTALTGALDVFANALLDGEDQSAAQQSALQFLLSAPAYRGAVKEVVPDSVKTLLGDAAVRQAFGVLAQQEVVAQMQAAGIKSKFLQKVAGQVVRVTVQDFLRKRAAAKLLDDVAVNVLLGELPVADVESYLIHAVVRRPGLQIAIGFSLGQGIGSLFGDNIVAHLIGAVVGIPATIFVGVASGLVVLYQWIFGGPALRGYSRYYQPVPAASDLYVMNAIVPDWQQADAVRAAMVTDGSFTLTGLTLTEPEGNQSGSVDLTMTVDTADSADSDGPAPLLVAFRFPLDRLLPGLDPATFSFAGTRSAQTVS